MQNTLEINSESTPAVSSVDFHHRRHTLTPQNGWMSRCLIRLQDAMENGVARASLRGDPHIYDTRLFPWAAEIEAEWQLIRKELDQVMTFRDQMPSFHEILKEVGTITTDNHWKTYFLTGIGMDCAENANRCPETMRLLGKIPGLKTAFFPFSLPENTSRRTAAPGTASSVSTSASWFRSRAQDAAFESATISIRGGKARP